MPFYGLENGLGLEFAQQYVALIRDYSHRDEARAERRRGDRQQHHRCNPGIPDQLRAILKVGRESGLRIDNRLRFAAGAARVAQLHRVIRGA